MQYEMGERTGFLFSTMSLLYIKNPAPSNLDIVESLEISGQLPAPVVNGREDSI